MLKQKMQRILLVKTIMILGLIAMAPAKASPYVYNVKKQARVISKKSDSLDQDLLALALTAYEHSGDKGIDNRRYLTVIDYSKPSNEPRLWVVDLKNNDVKYAVNVSHGKKSGLLNATHFSNEMGSNMSSYGVYKTGHTYQGKHGRSLRLHGLEKGINSNAYSRAVVMHGASYANDSFVEAQGFLGRSLGCPAVSQKVIQPIIDLIKEGSMIFAYYPDQKWLSSSSFLN